jgi:hypothetical protein
MELEALFRIFVVTALGALGWVAREVWSSITKLREDIREIEVDQAKNYVSKSDFTASMNEIKKGLDKIYDKLDAKADK